MLRLKKSMLENKSVLGENVYSNMIYNPGIEDVTDKAALARAKHWNFFFIKK